MTNGITFVRWFENQFNMLSGGLGSFMGDPDAWEGSIRTFERRDRRSPPTPGSVVFTGSSSITFWSSLERDMAPLPAVNRGFGGARMQDVVRYVDRIVVPYRPCAVVLFAGTNDIAWPKPATAQQVYDGYRAFVQRVRLTLTEVPLYFLSITPTPSRWRYWSIVREANGLIRAHAQATPGLSYIDLTKAVLGPDGRPNPGLYRSDRLHPNKKGYVTWTSVIKPVLEGDLLGGKAQTPRS